jgi:excisionase family DNA binding protein
MEQLLTPKQVADALGIHLNTVYRLIATGDLTAVRVGPKLLRVNRNELNSYMKGQE